ncbi:unnamed protein product [Brassica rapa subsp. trilocularis]
MLLGLLLIFFWNITTGFIHLLCFLFVFSLLGIYTFCLVLLWILFQINIFSFLSDVLFDQVSEDVLISGTIIQILNHVHPQKYRREVRLLRESKEHRVWTSPDSGKELCRKNSAFQHPLVTFVIKILSFLLHSKILSM